MKVLRKFFVFTCILSVLVTSMFPSGFEVAQARELGMGSANGFIEGVNIKFALKNFPKVWTGNYDGSNGSIPVNRKYALKITSIDEETGNFKGISYVDKGKDKPQYQHKAIFNVSGKIDIESSSITWERGEAVDNPGGLTWIKFTAKYSNDLRKIEGTDTSVAPAQVHLTNAVCSNRVAAEIDTETFDYDENNVNYDLANECMELSLLVYGNSCKDGNDYYLEAKNTDAAKNALKDKLIGEGFSSKDNMKLNSSSKESGDKKDCIHWVTAEKQLKDGSNLVYIIVKGTTGDEWYGNFNVYDEALREQNNDIHYSFNSAANALYSDVLEKYKDDKNIKYVVTGHSRGAAVANILAKLLTDEKDSNSNIKSVYGYTFATPTTIAKDKSGNYSNIFNFCFDDDFVTYMPLADADWQFGRYGTTYCVTAKELYSKYKFYRELTKNYFWGYPDSANSVSYKKDGAYEIADYLTQRCNSVPMFYGEYNYMAAQNGWDASWYEFFYYIFAPLMGGKSEDWGVATALLNKDFTGLISKFVVGGAGYGKQPNLMAYVGNTHDPGSYYALTQLLRYKEESCKDLYDISDSLLRNKLAKAYPATESLKSTSVKTAKLMSATPVSDYDEEQVDALKEFVNIDDNLSLLGWTIEDISTWNGIQWDSNGNVISIDIASIGLSGKLNLSSFSDLEILECTNNRLTELILPDIDNLDVYCDGNFLSTNPKNDLYKQLIKYSENGSVVSFSDQCVPENAKFNSTELTKLKQFANMDNNLDALGWDIDNPQSYSGIGWILINGTYYVESIELADLQLSGKIDISKFGYIKRVDLSNNRMTEVNASGCGSLESLNVCSNKITKLDISNLSKLSTLYCSDNYLVDNLSDDIIALKAQDKDTVVEIYPQYTDSSEKKFDEKELKKLKDFIGETIADIDWEHPGLNNCFQWEMVGNKYYLESLDLGGTEISGNIDLSEFAYLSKVNFFKTNITGIILPSSTTESDDYAFAYCPNLQNVSVTDSWTSMGTDVFYESPNVVLTCTRNTFAEFIAEALDIPFNEVVALAYLEVDGKTTDYYLQGEEFDLKGAELKVYYSDETTKNITDGYMVEGYDASKIGKQTVTLSYTEDNYTKSATLDIVVYGHTDDGLLYLFTDKNENKIQISGYIGDASDVTIPSEIEGVPVVKVADSAFEENETISSVYISESVTELGNHAFKNCSNLTSVNLPESLKTLGTYSFEECDKLEKVELPKSITKISEGAFYGCDKLSQVVSQGDLQYIEKNAFKNCVSIKEFDFGDVLKVIGERAFSGCSSLENAIMPDSITGLGTYIFENCTSLKKARINEGRVNIMEGLFDGCTNLEEVNIPDTVENIRELAFRHCEKLTEINLPDSVKLIEYGAFSHCYALKKISFSMNLSEIGNYAFYKCTSLEEALMPDTITSLGESVFADCTALKKVHVNEGRINITAGLFENCASLEEVNIPSTVENIRSRAFSGCTSLTLLSLPEGLKTIESNAFDGASIGSIEYAGSEEQLRNVDVSKTGNDILLSSSIKTLADGKSVVLGGETTDSSSNPSSTPDTKGNNTTSQPTKSPNSTGNGTRNSTGSSNSSTKKKTVNHATKVNLKNKKNYRKSKKVTVKDKDGIKTIKLNKKTIKVRGKKSFSFKLSKYKKYLKKKGKWNKIVITDMRKKKKTIKFKIK